MNNLKNKPPLLLSSCKKQLKGAHKTIKPENTQMQSQIHSRKRKQRLPSVHIGLSNHINTMSDVSNRTLRVPTRTLQKNNEWNSSIDYYSKPYYDSGR